MKIFKLLPLSHCNAHGVAGLSLISMAYVVTAMKMHISVGSVEILIMKTSTLSSAMSVDTANMVVLNSTSRQNPVFHLITWKMMMT
jgi:hypothetical protein